MQTPKLVVGYLMNSESYVKSVPIPKRLGWLPTVEVEELVEFFEELLKLVTEISAGQADSEMLSIFLAEWCELATGEANYEEMDADPDEIGGNVATQLMRLMEAAKPGLFRHFGAAVEDDDELDVPWLDTIEIVQEEELFPVQPYTDPEPIDVTEEERDEYLAQPLSELRLSTRAYNCLTRENIKTVRDLAVKTETQLLSYDNFGPASLGEVKEQLAKKGLYLEMEVEIDPEPIEVTEEERDEYLAQPISELRLHPKTAFYLTRENIKTVRDLVVKTEKELLSYDHFGVVSLREVKEELAKMELHLEMELSDEEEVEDEELQELGMRLVMQ